MLAAGRLRHRVVIKQPFSDPAAPARDLNGQPIEDWSKIVATVWAEIKPLSSRELFAAQQVQSPASHKITMRYLATVSTTHRIEYADPGTGTTRIFNIEGSPNCPDEKRECMELTAWERSK